MCFDFCDSGIARLRTSLLEAILCFIGFLSFKCSSSFSGSASFPRWISGAAPKLDPQDFNGKMPRALHCTQRILNFLWKAVHNCTLSFVAPQNLRPKQNPHTRQSALQLTVKEHQSSALLRDCTFDFVTLALPERIYILQYIGFLFC